MRNLNAVANECMKELDAIGIQYGHIFRFEVNTRAKNRWGQCKAVPGGYTININVALLDERSDINGLKNTIIHELLHSCKGCMNHGPEWKRLADKVNQAYGYGIKRCSSSEEKGAIETENKNEVVNYVLKCQKCGNYNNYRRISKAVIHPENYKCLLCGGKLTAMATNRDSVIRLAAARNQAYF